MLFFFIFTFHQFFVRELPVWISLHNSLIGFIIPSNPRIQVTHPNEIQVGNDFSSWFMEVQATCNRLKQRPKFYYRYSLASSSFSYTGSSFHVGTRLMMFIVRSTYQSDNRSRCSNWNENQIWSNRSSDTEDSTTEAASTCTTSTNHTAAASTTTPTNKILSIWTTTVRTSANTSFLQPYKLQPWYFHGIGTTMCIVITGSIILFETVVKF